MGDLKMLPLFDCVYLLALATWIGSLAFWLFGVLPVLRRRLGGAELDRAERELAQRCCLWGTVSGALALGSLVYGSLSTPALRGPLVGGASILIIAASVAMFYVSNGVLPRLAKATAESPADPAVGGRMRQTVQFLLTLSLVIGLGLMAAHAFRDTLRPRQTLQPRSSEEYRRFNDANARRNQSLWQEYQQAGPLHLEETRGEPDPSKAKVDPPVEAAR
jgi:hypothetical protein